MNPTDRHPNVARRDWLKLAGLGGLAVGITPTAAIAVEPVSRPRPVRGVVFMVSDGMSPGVITLAEAFSRITRKRGTRWWRLLDEHAAASGLMDTASANSLVTDSAAASSAWGGGKRVRNGQINIDTDGRVVTPIAAILKKAVNARIGLVTTATVTHATPAGFAANMASRNDEQQIAPQYLDRVDVILGGGSAFFDPKARADRHDLLSEYDKAGYQIVRHRDEMKSARSEKLLGVFTRGHLPFSIDRAHSETLQKRIPTLAEMAGSALSRFLSDKRPFLLQVEGARIDHAAHLNDIGGLLHDQLAFDDALERVMELTAGHSDILVVVTSDHGNANPGLNGIGAGYADSTQFFERVVRLKASHERVFSDWSKRGNKGDTADLAALVFERLDFHLRPNEAQALHAILEGRDVTEWNHLLDKPEGLLGQFIGNHTGIGWTGTTHTTDPTLVSAIGPQAQRFSGMVKNTDVFRHLVEMLG